MFYQSSVISGHSPKKPLPPIIINNNENIKNKDKFSIITLSRFFFVLVSPIGEHLETNVCGFTSPTFYEKRTNPEEIVLDFSTTEKLTIECNKFCGSQ